MSKEPQLNTNIWSKRDLGFDLPLDLTTFTPEDINYLRENNYPFLQIANANAKFDKIITVNLITLNNGWVVHDYGYAISISMPHNFESKKQLLLAQGAKGQIAVASEIAKIISTRGWGTVELIDGTKNLSKLLWIELRRFGLEFRGYEPSQEDEHTYNMVMNHTKARGEVWEKSLPQSVELKISGTK